MKHVTGNAATYFETIQNMADPQPHPLTRLLHDVYVSNTQYVCLTHNIQRSDS